MRHRNAPIPVLTGHDVEDLNHPDPRFWIETLFIDFTQTNRAMAILQAFTLLSVNRFLGCKVWCFSVFTRQISIDGHGSENQRCGHPRHPVWDMDGSLHATTLLHLARDW